jgi:hypothetical protein
MRLMCSLYRNEYRNFKLARATMGSRLGRVKKTGRGESMCGNNSRKLSVYYLYLKLAKMSYLLCFFFYKIGEQEGGTGSAWGWRVGVGMGGRGEVVGKEVGG